MPIVGAGLGRQTQDCGDAEGEVICGLDGIVLGGMAGMLVAAVVDSAALARETVLEPAGIVPVVQTGKDGGWVGVSGRF
jgi:hypothetical protein